MTGWMPSTTVAVESPDAKETYSIQAKVKTHVFPIVLVEMLSSANINSLFSIVVNVTFGGPPHWGPHAASRGKDSSGERDAAGETVGLSTACRVDVFSPESQKILPF